MDYFFSFRGGLVLFLIGTSVVLTFRNPKYGIVVFIILLFLREPFLMSWFPPAYEILHLPKVFGILTFISWFLNRKDYPIQIPSQLWLMLLFFGIILLSRSLAGSKAFGHKVPNDFFKMCVLFFLITNVIKSERDIKEIIWVLIVINVFATLYHYYYYKTGWKSVFVMPIFQFLNRNKFAGTLASMVPLTYFILWNSKSTATKVLLGFCLSSFIGGVILTYSRSGAFALFIGLITIMLLDKRKIRLVFIVLMLGLIMGPRISKRYVERITSIEHYEEDPSSMARVATNRAAINILKAHPLLGIGAGNFNSVFLDYTPSELLRWVRPGKSIHNVFLQVMSETGLVGLSVFIVLIFNTFIDVLKVRKKRLSDLSNLSVALGISLFVYLFHLQFHPGAYYSYIYIFIPLIVSTKLASYNL
ncbi:hypothetical protein CW705_05790 [Candidatus Bathyarchaeota archaeon]|nr:MAG: hypothetical protein CW705_05790 [Candidatus Bathyarchaeota archaeon]